MTRTLTNSQDPEHTGLAQLVAGDPVEEDLADMNGDGLPDRVTVDTDGEVRVALNHGYGFHDDHGWPEADALEQGSSEGESLGISFGFNVDKFGFSGGVNFSKDESTTDLTWDDVNGRRPPRHALRERRHPDGCHQHRCGAAGPQAVGPPGGGRD